MKFLKFVLCMSIILFAFPAISEIYKYVDEYGNTHFTDDFSKVPVEQRPAVNAGAEYENDTAAEQVAESEASYDADNDFTDKAVEGFADNSENLDEAVESDDATEEDEFAALDQDPENEAELLPPFDEAEPEKDLNAIRNQLEAMKIEIDGEYQDLVREKDKLAKEKKSLKNREEILQHNKEVEILNKKVEAYEKKGKIYEARVEAYNKRVGQENAKAKKKAETQ